MFLILVEFTTYVDYTQKLEYEQNPDYEYLRGLFKAVLKNQGLENDLIFDWNNRSQSKKSQKLNTGNHASGDVNQSKQNLVIIFKDLDWKSKRRFNWGKI